MRWKRWTATQRTATVEEDAASDSRDHRPTVSSPTGLGASHKSLNMSLNMSDSVWRVDLLASTDTAFGDVKFRHQGPCIRRIGASGTHATRSKGLSLRVKEIECIAQSFSVSRRHLAALSVRALGVGTMASHAMRRESGGNGVDAWTAVQLLCRSLAAPEPARPEGHINTEGDRLAHPALVMNAVLHAYMDDTGATSPTPTVAMPLASTDEARNAELYADEMHSCAWRLAIECVKECELSLAEALFTMHLLLEHPDLFLVLFDVPVPNTLDEVIAQVCRAASPTAAGTVDDNINVGRLWSAFYAAHLFGASASRYDEQLRQSMPPSVAVISMLLGLHEKKPALEAGGCTPHLLKLEVRATVPSLAEVPGLFKDILPPAENP
jgi:hypothetical protein